MKPKSLLAALIIGSSLAARAALAGHWVEVPPPSDPFNTYPFDIVAIADNDVWLIGAKYSSGYFTLVEHWDGAAWTVVPSPNPSRKSNFLLGATGISRKDVWAVGNRVQGSVQQTLIEHWNGRKWAVVTSPNVAGSGVQSALQSISAVSASDIWAVGAWYEPNGQQHPLTLHWDGTAWSIVPSPSVSYDVLFSVAALAPNDVWAVGRSGSSPALYQTLTLHWDGTAWSVVPSPNVGTRSALANVDGTGPNDVWAVGNSGYFGIDGQTLALHWNGSAWSVVPTAHTSSDETLSGIVALATDDFAAVGEDHRSRQGLAEDWDGTAWTLAALPPATPDSLLRRVTASRTGSLWAIGTQASGSEPLVLQQTP